MSRPTPPSDRPLRHDLLLPHTKSQYKRGFRIDVSGTRSGRALQFDQGGEKWRAEWSEVEEARGHALRQQEWRVIRSHVTDSLDGLPAHAYNTHSNGVWRSATLVADRHTCGRPCPEEGVTSELHHSRSTPEEGRES